MKFGWKFGCAGHRAGHAPQGWEVRGLVHGTNIRPDGYVEAKNLPRHVVRVRAKNPKTQDVKMICFVLFSVWGHFGPHA